MQTHDSCVRGGLAWKKRKPSKAVSTIEAKGERRGSEKVWVSGKSILLHVRVCVCVYVCVCACVCLWACQRSWGEAGSVLCSLIRASTRVTASNATCRRENKRGRGSKRRYSTFGACRCWYRMTKREREREREREDPRTHAHTHTHTHARTHARTHHSS